MKIEMICDKKQMQFLRKQNIKLNEMKLTNVTSTMNVKLKIEDKEYNAIYKLDVIKDLIPFGIIDETKYPKIIKQIERISINDFMNEDIIEKLQLKDNIIINDKRFYSGIANIKILGGKIFVEDLPIIEY